ncbi:trypsin-like peptidase domain-containing protein [Candidatus Bathyarchaeota archaeon]|nr:trypsin-like peptidase domain-containing protein [Candidatus Bathyarchaeota archaeon]
MEADYTTFIFKSVLILVLRVAEISELDESYKKTSTTLLVLLFVAGLLVGGIVSFYVTFEEINQETNLLRAEIGLLQSQVSKLEGFQSGGGDSFNITVYQNATALSELYASLRDSIVLVQGTTSSGDVQASGFIYNFSGTMVVITNYHVVHDTNSLSITFSNGNGYFASILGTDPYVDLAVLNITAPAHEFQPIEIVSSSNLKVGDQVIAIGNPYGLVGSLTTGVVSALGRTLTEEEYAGDFSIANIIQTSAPINPGNSGGPLLNLAGKVVGITTAIVSNSQGLGFAVSSNTILREISALVTTGTFQGHSYLGVSGLDMNYKRAQEIGLDITYGWRIEKVNNGGPSDGRLRSGDVILALNGTAIRNNDDLASYLAEETMPGELLVITILRDGLTEDVNVILGARPPPPV